MAWHDALSKKYQTRRANKYGAIKVKTEGHTYDSKGEHEMHSLLCLMQRGNLICEIVHHPGSISLTKHVNYRPDFRVFEHKRGIYVYIEFKGMDGERWRVIRNLWREFGDSPLQIWKKDRNRLYLAEELKST